MKYQILSRITFRYFSFLILLVLTGAVFGQDTSGDREARLIAAPQFKISAEDETAGINGKMKVGLEIDETGKVTSSWVYVAPEWPCKGNLEGRVRKVMKDAEKAARDFKFSPALAAGKPVASRIGVVLAIGKAAHADEKADSKDTTSDSALPKTIAGGVINGKARRLEKPAYPYEARAARVEGAVTVRVVIGEDGKVLRAQALDGNALLHFAARNAACASVFAPTTLSGAPIKVSGEIIYKFVAP